MKPLLVLLLLVLALGCGSSEDTPSNVASQPLIHTEQRIPVFHARTGSGRLVVNNGQVTVTFDRVTGTIRGQEVVVAPDTLPVADELLTQLASEVSGSEDSSTVLLEYDLPQVSTTSDGSLSFEFGSAVAEDFVLSGQVINYSGTSARLLSQAVQQNTIEENFGGATLTVFSQGLEPQLTGRVTRGGEVPVANATVTVRDLRNGVTHLTTSRPDGHYFFIDLQAGGPYIVSASVDGATVSDQAEVTIVADEIATVDINLNQ